MSKAFTRESDDPLDELLSVDDHTLPEGEPNYVTPDGAARLRDAIERLRAAPRSDPRRRAAIEQRLASLLRRLEAAEIVDPQTQPRDRVRFGATVTVRDEEDRERRYSIVGVDEADARRGRLSWRSPMAKALLGRRVGDTATVHAPGGDEELDVVAIDYDVDAGLGAPG